MKKGSSWTKAYASIRFAYPLQLSSYDMFEHDNNDNDKRVRTHDIYALPLGPDQTGNVWR